MYIFHIPCPTCGSTRALVALCRLDWTAYMDYQPFSLPLVIAVWLLLHGRLFSRPRVVYGGAMMIVLGNFFFYLWRLPGWIG